MRTKLFISCLALSAIAMAGVPDSVFVRPAGMPRGEGMLLQWSSEGEQWKNATEGRILGSDFGTWGAEKKLYAPSMTVGEDGTIAVVFQVNERSEQFAVCTTRDFIHWRPQDYPLMKGCGQCLEPIINKVKEGYKVTFHNKQGEYFSTSSADLIHFSAPVKAQKENAVAIRLPYNTIQAVKDNQQAFQAREKLINELAKDNATRFAGINGVSAEICVDAANKKAISDKLIGIFFEDINYSADGGLNAQLLQNGDFEYQPSDRKGDKNWNSMTAWEKVDGIEVSEIMGVSANNSHAMELKGSGCLANTGFNGIVLKKGEKYDFSMFLRGGKALVSLMDGDKVLAAATLSAPSTWRRVKVTLVSKGDAKNAQLRISPMGKSIGVDMLSLMPRDTYKGHGLRRDLAEALEALHPRFMRFPGGCVTHGDGIGNIYHWKETIGEQKDRKPLRNIWNYHQSRQLGFYEFFQMCEDMNMEPLPVLSAGVPCQNSSTGGDGQQGGIPMEEMPAYVQEILDLIEWANGDATTEWGAKRIAQGHKKPFNLHYLGIGNEDLISPTFTERYLMICKAVKAKYPEIQICGTAGPFYYGSDYEEGWRVATEHKDVTDLVDEHYYLPPSWFVYNQDFYDQYSRQAPKVYLGEWAAHGPGRKSTIETALSEALYVCSLERNADVVVMSSYAPLLAREGNTQWNPNMIYFNATEVHPTVGYYSQLMCGQSQGDTYIHSTITTKERRAGVGERLAVSTVQDSKSGRTFLKVVNLLPVSVEASCNLTGIVDGERTCKATILTGTYDSTSARPEKIDVNVAPSCQLALPAYSFMVIEL